MYRQSNRSGVSSGSERCGSGPHSVRERQREDRLVFVLGVTFMKLCFGSLMRLRILLLTPTLLFTNQALAQQVDATGPALPIVQVHHVQGDPYEGFRLSCLVIFSDGEYHRERRVQVSGSGRALPSWEEPIVAEGSLSTKEIEGLLTRVDEPSFSSITGVIGDVLDLRRKVAFYRDGSIVPHDSIDFFAVSIGRPKGTQSFETSPKAGNREPVRIFLELFRSIEKRQAARLPSSQASGCVQLAGKVGLPTQTTMQAGFKFPMVRGPNPIVPPGSVRPGTVKVSFLVNPDGTVGDIKVRKSATIEAAQVATGAASKWAFYPARLLGVPVAFEMQAEMTFSDSPNVQISPMGHLHSALDK